MVERMLLWVYCWHEICHGWDCKFCRLVGLYPLSRGWEGAVRWKMWICRTKRRENSVGLLFATCSHRPVRQRRTNDKDGKLSRKRECRLHFFPSFFYSQSVDCMNATNQSHLTIVYKVVGAAYYYYPLQGRLYTVPFFQSNLISTFDISLFWFLQSYNLANRRRWESQYYFHKVSLWPYKVQAFNFDIGFGPWILYEAQVFSAENNYIPFKYTEWYLFYIP